MHPVLANDPKFSGALSDYQQSVDVLEGMLERVAVAHREHEALKFEVMSRGEVFAPPLVPIVTAEVEEFVRKRVAEMAHEYVRRARAEAQRLREAMEARQAELLAKALKTSAGGLDPIAAELTSLLDSWGYLDGLVNTPPGLRDRASRDVVAGEPISVHDVLAAATGERSLVEARSLVTAAAEAERERREQLARTGDRVRR